MDPYSSEEEQIEKLRQWWKENGPYVIGGVVLGFGVLFGWRSWGEYRESTLAGASAQYEQLVAVREAGDLAQAETIAEELRAARLRTPYADMAALEIAGLAVETGDTATAVRELERVLDGKPDRSIAHLARLRLARIHLAEGDFDAAGTLLAHERTGRYAPLYHEMRGDLALARGDRALAIENYRLALVTGEDGIADRAIIEMKLDDLGASRSGQGA